MQGSEGQTQMDFSAEMDDNQLTDLFQRVLRGHLGRKRRRVVAQFHPYRSLRHTIEWNPWRITVKVNHHFYNAPLQIMESLAVILLSKVYKVQVDRQIRTIYRKYLDQLATQLPLRRHNTIEHYESKGKYFDLQNIFDDLNRQYFKQHLKSPVIGWSKTNSRSRLGFYDYTRNLLVISRIFDRSGIPEEVVRYLVFHEMLHIHFPVEIKNGRRSIHPPAFKKVEKQFPQYEKIQHWLKTARFSR